MIVDLEQLTDGVSQTAVKHWLKVNGLEHTAQNTEEYYQRLAKLIEDEELTVEELRGAVLEIQEYGGKRIGSGSSRGCQCEIVAMQKQAQTNLMHLL